MKFSELVKKKDSIANDMYLSNDMTASLSEGVKKCVAALNEISNEV